MTLRGLPSVLLAVLMGLAVLFSTLASAEDSSAPPAPVGDPEHGRTVYQKIGYCVNCHGWAGDGQSGRNPLSHAAATNLRETKLDAQGLLDVIRCGIPGTQMPYHDGASYKDGRCYGLLMSDFDENQQPVRGKTFRERQMVDLIAYLGEYVIGHGEPTYEECVLYFDTSADRSCAYLKSQ